MISDSEIMAQVLVAFKEEQSEHRQAIGELLLVLEREPEHLQRKELLDQLFREAHSLKGGARAAGQAAIEQIAHRLEDMLSAVRQGVLELTSDVCDPIYASLDAIGALASQGITGLAPDLAPYQPLLRALDQVLHDVAVRPTARDVVAAEKLIEPASNAVLVPAKLLDALDGTIVDTQGGDSAARKSDATVRLSTATLDDLLSEAGELITCAVRAEQRTRDAQALNDLPLHWRRTWRRTRPAVARLQQRVLTVQPVVHYLDRTERAATPAGSTIDHDTTVLLDALLEAQRVIGDLERRIQTHARTVAEDHDRLISVTDRLHDQIRRTRMLPVATLLGPLRLQLREMARTANKQVVLELDDGGAEADRQVLDGLREVLLHLLRNAVDHGIEVAEERPLVGKPVDGQIHLHAAVAAGRLTLTLTDDGAGIDRGAIRRRALAVGLATEGDLVRMSDTETLDLIFTPGFSTKESVSVLSGRGVGLDVVRTQVERMHGHVSVQSERGTGTIFTLSVPLSLTSTQGLLLRVARTRYALPLERVQRIVPVTANEVITLEGRSAIVLDEHPVPLVYLGDVLQESGGAGNNAASATLGLALVLSSGERQVACLVDAVLGEQEVVVQRLPQPLGRVRFIMGATILADGAVVPILDVVDIVRTALGARGTMTVAPNITPTRSPLIVIADDSITTRTLERNILEAAGYRVQLATDGAEAWHVLERLADDSGCDLLLSDVDMPRLNGFDLAAKVRADSRFKRLPIVLVTSLDTPQDRERGIAAGADAYIVKRAFDQHTLLQTISQLI